MLAMKDLTKKQLNELENNLTDIYNLNLIKPIAYTDAKIEIEQWLLIKE